MSIKGISQWKLMDDNATRETKKLFKSLKKIQEREPYLHTNTQQNTVADGMVMKFVQM